MARGRTRGMAERQGEEGGWHWSWKGIQQGHRELDVGNVQGPRAVQTGVHRDYAPWAVE